MGNGDEGAGVIPQFPAPRGRGKFESVSTRGNNEYRFSPAPPAPLRATSGGSVTVVGSPQPVSLSYKLGALWEAKPHERLTHMKRWNFLGDRRVVMVIMSIAMVLAFLSFATITNTQGVQSAPWAHGYQLRNLVSCPNGVGFSATLQLTKNTSTYGEDIQALTLSVRW